MDKHNSISAEVEHASRQLDAVAQEHDLRLLWYRADRGPFVSDTKEQIVSTLYGMRRVLADHPLHARVRGTARMRDMPTSSGSARSTA